MRILGLLVVLTACTSSAPTKDDAVEVFKATENASYWMLIQTPGEASATDGGSFATPCPIAGTAQATGTYDERTGNLAAFGRKFSLDTQFIQCNLGNPTGRQDADWDAIVDGKFHWVSEGLTQQMDGFLDYQGHQGEFECTASLHMTAHVDNTWHYAGTLCGYDLQTELGITP